MLAEVIEEDLRALACYSQRCVVSHGSYRLCTVDTHGYDGLLDILFAIAECQQPALQIIYLVGDPTAALQVLQLDAVGTQPLLIGMGLGQTVLYLAVIIDFAFLRIDEQQFSWLQTSLLGYLSRLEIHHAHLTCNHHHTLVGNGVAAGSETVSVKHTTGIATVTEEQRGRSVPRFHQYGVVFVEGFQFVRDGVLVVEALGYHDGHSLWQRESTHNEELKHIVQTGRVTHARLYDGTDVFHAAQCFAVEHTLAGFHP